jgi:hypothetical protein
MAGDDNRNAAVEVAWRVMGEGDWRPGLPLIRLDGEMNSSGSAGQWVAPHMFAGSLLDLAPATAYEIRLSLSDPDGVRQPDGTAIDADVRVLPLTTRGWPEPPAGGETHHVYPAGWAGARAEPAYDSVEAAYATAEPGDVVALYPGVHRPAAATGFRFDRAFPPNAPLALHGVGEGVVLDGDGHDVLLDLRDAAHHQLRDLTFRRAQTLALLGDLETGSAAITFERCLFDSETDTVYDDREQHWGLICNSPDCIDLLVVDSVFDGPKDTWARPTPPYSTGLRVAGRGHVIAYNDFSGYRDGLSLYRPIPIPEPARQTHAIDIYGNDISECDDDGAQLDMGFQNLRFMRNTVHRTMMGLSFQTVYGGPAYVYRNVFYNQSVASLKTNGWPAGLMIFNNTFAPAKSAASFGAFWQNSQWLNNLFVGTDRGEKVIGHGTPLPGRAVLDHNGYHWHETEAAWKVAWTQYEAPDGTRDIVQAAQNAYQTLEAFTDATGFERNGISTVTPDDFLRYVLPNGEEADAAPDLDLRLGPDAPAIDAGRHISNITDDFVGGAPDLGAFERGAAPPRWGPRR